MERSCEVLFDNHVIAMYILLYINLTHMATSSPYCTTIILIILWCACFQDKRDLIVQEFFSSEKQYVETLLMLVEVGDALQNKSSNCLLEK